MTHVDVVWKIESHENLVCSQKGNILIQTTQKRTKSTCKR